MQIIILHEEDSVRDVIKLMLSKVGEISFLDWKRGTDIQPDYVLPQALAVVHASNDIQSADNAEVLIRCFAEGERARPGRNWNRAAPYAALGLRLRELRAAGIVVVSGDSEVSWRLVPQSDTQYKHVWASSVASFLDLGTLFLSSLMQEELPLDFFAQWDNPSLHSALNAFYHELKRWKGFRETLALDWKDCREALSRRFSRIEADCQSDDARAEASAIHSLIAGPLGEEALNGIYAGLHRLEKALSYEPDISQIDLSDAALDETAPLGWENLLVADDYGYPLECQNYLRSKGYDLLVLTTIGETENTLSGDSYPVFLCDQTFDEDPGAGRRLMRKARSLAEKQRKTPPFIIARSVSALDLKEFPEADAKCDTRYADTEQGARYVHKLICDRAASSRQ